MPFKTKETKNLYYRAYRRANSEQTKTTKKAYYQRNPEQKKKEDKAYRERDPERIKARRKAYYDANSERIKAHVRAYQQANAECLKGRSTAYWRANAERLKAHQKVYRQTNPARKLAVYYRNRIGTKLRNQNARKSQRSVVFLGCDIPWLIAWLEVQFQPRMTWENYGPVWHVDHKRPCASFDLSDPAEQRLCFHWTNLQPLFAEENLSKGSRWEIPGEAA